MEVIWRLLSLQKQANESFHAAQPKNSEKETTSVCFEAEKELGVCAGQHRPILNQSAPVLFSRDVVWQKGHPALFLDGFFLNWEIRGVSRGDSEPQMGHLEP